MKATKTWLIRVDNDEHQVNLRHNALSANYNLRVDGKRVEPLMITHHPLHPDTQLATGFLDDHMIAVAVKPEGRRYHYDLLIDGASVENHMSLFVDVPEHYQALAVPVYATQAHIQAAYQGWLARFEDPRAGAKPEVQARIAVIRRAVEQAYAVLNDPDQRAKYNLTHLGTASVALPKPAQPGVARAMLVLGLVTTVALLLVIWLAVSG